MAEGSAHSMKCLYLANTRTTGYEISRPNDEAAVPIFPTKQTSEILILNSTSSTVFSSVHQAILENSTINATAGQNVTREQNFLYVRVYDIFPKPPKSMRQLIQVFRDCWLTWRLCYLLRHSRNLCMRVRPHGILATELSSVRSPRSFTR